MTVAVLLIDDDKDRADTTVAALETYGFEVTRSDNATASIGAFLAEPHDVVLVPVAAVGAQGLMVAEAIRNSPGGTEAGIVLWADSAGTDDRRYGVADAVLPADTDALFLRTVLVEVAHDKTGAVLDTLVVNAPQLQLRSGRSAVVPPSVASLPPTVADEPVIDSPRPSPPAKASPVRVEPFDDIAEFDFSDLNVDDSPAAEDDAEVDDADVVEETLELVNPSTQQSPFATAAATVRGFHVGGDAEETVRMPPAKLDAVLVEATPPKVPQTPGLPQSGELSTHPIRALLLAAARGRASCILEVRRGDDRAQVAFVRGIIMGATDTDPETRLGTRLIRRKKIEERQLNEAIGLAQKQGVRLAEALVELDALSAGELLEELAGQSRERAVRVAGWREGTFSVSYNLEALEALSIAPIDMLDVMLEWHLRRPDRDLVYAWLRDHMDEQIVLSPGHDHMLDAFGLALPDSTLPRVFKKKPRSLREALAGVSHGTQGDSTTRDRALAELYGAWASTVFYLDSDGAPPETPLPLRLRAQEKEEVGYDRDLAAEVQKVWLKTQGRDFYAIVGATPSDAPTVLEAKVRAFQSKFGPEALRDANLGPVQQLGSALAGLCAELDFVLTDESRRESYTREITANFERTIETPGPELEAELDVAESAIDDDDFDTARVILMRLAEESPDDPRIESNLAYIALRQKAEAAQASLESLSAVCARTPGRARALYLLGHGQALLGRHVDAMKTLSKASRQSPDDPRIEELLGEVVRSLASL